MSDRDYAKARYFIQNAITNLELARECDSGGSTEADIVTLVYRLEEMRDDYDGLIEDEKAHPELYGEAR